MNSKVDMFLQKSQKWQSEMLELRRILLDCQLTEEYKWRKPCYTYNQRNILIIYSLKDFCGPGFFKGALLKDEEGILVKPGENSQSTRYLKFTNTQQIIQQEGILKAYIYEAIEVEKAGLEVDFKAKSELVFPDELLTRFKKNPALETAFKALTLGRQREYNLYFTAAKQSKTKESRINSYEQRILEGNGKSDCLCGLSKRMPRCDGSHKYLN